MSKTHQLRLAIITFCFVNLAYSGPCYTDTGDCGKEQKVIMVKPKKTGDGFCIESLNDKNEKESKCYYHRPQLVTEETSNKEVVVHKVTKKEPNQTPVANSSFIYSSSFESTQFNDDNYSNGYNYSNYYNGYYNGYYNNNHNNHHHRPPKPHRPHKPKPPKPKPESINGIKRSKNIYYVPANIKPDQRRDHYFNRGHNYNGGGHHYRNGSRSNGGRTAAGTINSKR